MLCVDINDTVIQCSLGNSCNLECYCSKLQLLKRILYETSHFNCDTDKNNIMSLHLTLDINHTTHISHISHQEIHKRSTRKTQAVNIKKNRPS